MCDGEPVSLLQQEKRLAAHSLGLAGTGRKAGDPGGGDRGLAQALVGSHPPWDSFQWSFICRKMETTAPLALVGNWKHKNGGASKLGKTGRESSVCWVSSSRCRRGLCRGPRGIASVNRKPRVLTHFSFILMAFLLFRKGRKKAKSFLPDLGPCH